MKYLAVVFLALISITMAAPGSLRADQRHKPIGYVLFKKALDDRQSDVEWFQTRESKRQTAPTPFPISLFGNRDAEERSAQAPKKLTGMGVSLFKKASPTGGISLFKKQDHGISLFKKAAVDYFKRQNVPVPQSISLFKKNPYTSSDLEERQSDFSLFKKAAADNSDPNEVCRFESQQEIDPKLFNFCCKIHSHVLTAESMMLCALASW